jgi:hypothetical protein
VVVLFLDDGFERLHVVAFENLLAQNVAELVLLHEHLNHQKTTLGSESVLLRNSIQQAINSCSVGDSTCLVGAVLDPVACEEFAQVFLGLSQTHAIKRE